eukprot:jgi/Tetstr1/436369/TSEL_025202.t1
MMEELRKLWHLLDIHDISIRPRYIQSAADVWADRLSRELDDADWQLYPRIFAYMQRLWGPHTIDRFWVDGLLTFQPALNTGRSTAYVLNPGEPARLYW